MSFKYISRVKNKFKGGLKLNELEHKGKENIFVKNYSFFPERMKRSRKETLFKFIKFS